MVSSVATPQNCGPFDSLLLMSSTKRPEVAPTVPSLMIFSWPENVSVKTFRAVSISSVTDALSSNRGSLVRPAAFRMIPPDSSM